MKKFVWFIFLLLMAFSFCGLAGTVFAGIVPGSVQMIVQTAAGPNLIDSDIVNHSFSYAKANVMDDCFILKQHLGTSDNQTTIKNIKESRIVLADNTLALENGTVLKCPIYRRF